MYINATKIFKLGIAVARDLWSPPIHGYLHIFVDPVTRLVEKNPRIGEKFMNGGGPKARERERGA